MTKLTHDYARSLLKLHRLVSQGRLTEAVEFADALLSDHPTDLEVRYLRGAALFQAGEFHMAIETFEDLLGIAPENLDALRAKALCLAEDKRYAEAIDAYAKALECAPEDHMTLIEMAKAFANMGRHRDAVECFRRAVSSPLVPPQAADYTAIPRGYLASAWHYMARSQECLGEYDDALRSFDTAVRLDSERADAWTDRGVFFGRRGQEKLSSDSLETRTFGVRLLYEELRCLDKALQIAPCHPEASHNRRALLDAMGPKFGTRSPTPLPGSPGVDESLPEDKTPRV